jgi:hypothetical protein
MTPEGRVIRTTYNFPPELRKTTTYKYDSDLLDAEGSGREQGAANGEEDEEGKDEEADSTGDGTDIGTGKELEVRS